MPAPAIGMGPFAGSMEEIMSKTNETPKLDHAAPKDRSPLDDTELKAVSGGGYSPGKTYTFSGWAHFE